MKYEGQNQVIEDVLSFSENVEILYRLYRRLIKKVPCVIQQLCCLKTVTIKHWHCNTLSSSSLVLETSRHNLFREKQREISYFNACFIDQGTKQKTIKKIIW